MDAFERLQSRLGEVWALNRPGAAGEHVLVALPSFSVGESLLSHYAERIPALEHRYLVAHLILHRLPGCEMVFVSSEEPAPEVVEYYTSLAPPECRDSVRRRFRALTVPDGSARSVAAKLLDRPDLIDELRRSFAGRPVLIEPWNVTDDEVEVALRLGAPVNGTHPSLWPLGYKSAGRRLFAAAGVPTPCGQEDVRTVDDVVAAVAAVRRDRPGVAAVVVKHDNSGAGDGNVVVALDDLPPGEEGLEAVRSRVEALPEWYLDDLRLGAVVEERIAGDRFSSPSVQLDICPDGDVAVLATHEQVLGGDDGQVYTGCRFPADPAYAGEVGRYGRTVGERLSELGVRGRVSVDFVACAGETGRWGLFALEVNLRKGGTTHPYAALRNLVPGHYDVDEGRWCAADGTPRAYCATDNLVDEAWTGLPPAAVIGAVAGAGLEFDRAKGTGVVLHMLAGLGIDGRFGVTAIGRTPEEAEALRQAVATAVSEEAARPSRRSGGG